ncbi:protein Flattop [Mixophyes fleayi]|uniref:protein Flattop n=1 Tax=Mixophyes fleayi TaxID=3061075 RepID=UPI003F4E39DF
MAAHYSANQYQSAFSSNNLQNWNIPKPYKERPDTHEGYTQFIANDRGHLFPSVPKSKASPWGTFIGTWDMPTKIPPAKLSLTSRSADASKRLIDWVERSEPLTSACNGLRLDITGKFPNEKQEQEKHSPSPKSERASVTSPKEAAAKTPPRSASSAGSHRAERTSRRGQGEEGGTEQTSQRG